MGVKLHITEVVHVFVVGLTWLALLQRYPERKRKGHMDRHSLAVVLAEPSVAREGAKLGRAPAILAASSQNDSIVDQACGATRRQRSFKQPIMPSSLSHIDNYLSFVFCSAFMDCQL